MRKILPFSFGGIQRGQEASATRSAKGGSEVTGPSDRKPGRGGLGSSIRSNQRGGEFFFLVMTI